MFKHSGNIRVKQNTYILSRQQPSFCIQAGKPKQKHIKKRQTKGKVSKLSNGK